MNSLCNFNQFDLQNQMQFSHSDPALKRTFNVHMFLSNPAFPKIRIPRVGFLTAYRKKWYFCLALLLLFSTFFVYLQIAKILANKPFWTTMGMLQNPPVYYVTGTYHSSHIFFPNSKIHINIITTCNRGWSFIASEMSPSRILSRSHQLEEGTITFICT